MFMRERSVFSFRPMLSRGGWLIPDNEHSHPAGLHVGFGSGLFRHTQYRDRAFDGCAADRASQSNWVPRGGRFWLQPPAQRARRARHAPGSISHYPIWSHSALCRIGVGYALNLGNISDGILTNISVDQNFALILQAGADWMLTPNWGVFVDGKKAFLSTDTQGFAVPGNVPVRAPLTLDPWLASAGVTFKY
jgi:OmpW family